MGGICFFNTAKAWGGGEKWHFEVSKHLFSKGHDVTVFARADSVLLQKLKAANIPSQGVHITNLSFLNPFKRLSIFKLLKKGNFDTIVMNLSRDIKIAGPGAKKAHINRIIYRRGSAIPIKNTFLNRHYFKNILTEVLANSEATKKTILENNPNLFPKDKIKVIYNGIDIVQTNVIENHRSKTSSKKITLINLGRLEYQKNQIFLVQLSKVLKKMNIPHQIIVGGSGRLQDKLDASIQELGVNNSVTLEGFIEKPLEFMQKGDVFVLPSLWEGFGYVLAEAALCKKPIIAFDLSSNPELVIDNKSGFLVPLNDVEAFAEKVQTLYEHPEMVTLMGQAGYDHISQNFDKKKQIEKIESYLIDGE